jgi:hypothetical protein
MGGEFKYNKSKGKWVIDNDSSYSFFRDDKRVLSNASGVNWQGIISSLFKSWNVDLQDVIWLDLVQSRKLDSFIVQKISHGYSRMLREGEMETAFKQMGIRHKYLKLFSGVNFLEMMLGAFGANVFFLTQGKLSVEIVETKNIDSLMRFNVTDPHLYCKVSMKGSEGLKHYQWWTRPQRTSSKKSRDPKWDDKLDVYVTDRVSQVLEVVLMVDMSASVMPDQVLGYADIELDCVSDACDEWITIQPAVIRRNSVFEDVTSDNSDNESPVDAFSLIGRKMSLALSSLTTKNPQLHVLMTYIPHISPKEVQAKETITPQEVQ